MKRILLLILALFVFVACSNNKQKERTKETMSEKKEGTKNNKGESAMLNQIEGFREGNVKVKMLTNKGEIKFILFPDVAPKAVENFTTHAKNGYYNGVIFHRVIKDFMIQGGDPEGTGRGGKSIWGESFKDEFDVKYRHFTGALSMANAGPNTNGSQFFIVTAKNNISPEIIKQMRESGEEKGFPKEVVDAYEKLGGTYHLDGKHTVFGHVIKGMEVVQSISEVETGVNDKPKDDVIIEKIIVE